MSDIYHGNDRNDIISEDTMKRLRKIGFILLAAAMFFTCPVYAAGAYKSESINGIKINHVDIKMESNIKSVVLNAGNQMNSTDSLANMAKNAGAFAAINGTYFEAYGGIPVPWGTLIKNNKVLHISNGGSVVGITSEGKLIVDRLTFDFEGYINGVYRAIPWRINHPSTEAEAITIFTPEYGTTVNVSEGAKAVIVTNGKVTDIATWDFNIPADGFAILYNASTAYLVDERYKIGDEVYYKVKINTTFTSPEDWDDIVCGLGAGPSLIINGVITADGPAEGFMEAKINMNSAGRSFIGAKADGTIIIGNMGSATIASAAEACRSMGLVNAMCLDGGGSIALYYPSSNVNMSGRKINNALAFVEEKEVVITATPTSSPVIIDGKTVDLDVYNINNSNYFKLRDIAMLLNNSKKQFGVEWEASKNAINLIRDCQYVSVGGELSELKDRNIKRASVAKSDIYIDGTIARMTAYNIDSNSYFKLRDIAEQLNFGVDWDSNTNSIIIRTE